MMVLSITQWIDEHHGRPSIISTHALSIYCTCFLEMYHVSRQSFYIIRLSPENATTLASDAEVIYASDGSLQSLRSYTSKRKGNMEGKARENIHNKFKNIKNIDEVNNEPLMFRLKEYM
jgi:hypothetical protein